jgi:heptose I phosphotransferase
MTWLTISETHRDLLKAGGLETFSDFMTFQGGQVLKRLPSRMILKVTIPFQGANRNLFLKRHTGAITWGERLRAAFSGFSPSWGRKEWEVIQAFRESGIPTLTAAAAGERSDRGRRESFVMTEELEGFCSLEEWVRQHVAPPLSAVRIREKRAMIREVARIARTMHGEGFNHRDFYLCHIFVRERGDGTWDWRVLDLQRVDRRRWFRRRWLIKDLAALHFSSPSPQFTRTDRLRFLKVYLNRNVSRERDLSLIHQIQRKTDRIARHDRKLKRERRLAAGGERTVGPA